MTYDPSNPFARIIRGELPSIRVYEDALTIAIMDIMPQADGHTLVIPRTAGENLLDTPPESAAATMLTAQRIARAVDRAFTPKGIVVTQFNRAAAGQTVFHLHVHVIPVYEAGEWRMHARTQADFGLLQAQAERIRAALDA